MNAKKYIFSISLIIFACGLIILGYYSMNLVGADIVQGNKVFERDISADYKASSGTLMLQSYQTNSGYTHRLLLKKGIFVNQSLVLTGFGDNIGICQDKKITVPPAGNYICLIGDVGVHSMNLQIIRYDSRLTVLQVKTDSDFGQNITSDLPFFAISDYDNDGNYDLIVYNRDYDTDPLTQAIASYYKADKNGNFGFDKKSGIAYHMEGN